MVSENDRPDEAIDGGDDELQRELDEALGSMSVGSLMDVDAPGAPSGTGQGVRKGKVIAVHRGDIFVDLGGKSQGLLTADQWGGKALPAVGDWIEVTIEGYNGAEGMLILSRQGAVQAATWQTMAEGTLVEGRVKDHNKGGLELDINGIRAFMPISQIDFERIESDQLGQFVNQRLRCEVVEVRRDERTVVVSRRNALQREREAAGAELMESLQEGQLVHGTVKTIMPYGAFVDIGGIDGLVHISDMSHSRVGDPREVVTEGQQLEVKILKIDRETRKISLGLKQVMPDPWDSASGNYPPDAIVSGRVVKLMDFGAFVELEPGVQGLVPISEMTFERRIGHPREVVSEGEVIKVRVLNVDPAAGRMSLSIKRVGDDPWTGASVRWPVDSIVEGVVKRTTDFGAFVELTPGVEGLVHISELSETRVRQASDVVKVGQTLRVKVLEVDEERHRISLSLKEAAADEYFAAPADAEPAAPRPEKKRKKPLKGGLEL